MAEPPALLAELGLRGLEAENDMVSALSAVMQANGLASKSDLVGYMKAECGGVTDDALKEMDAPIIGLTESVLENYRNLFPILVQEIERRTHARVSIAKSNRTAQGMLLSILTSSRVFSKNGTQRTRKIFTMMLLFVVFASINSIFQTFQRHRVFNSPFSSVGMC